MSGTPRRIGVFGGTFDPVHLGHLILAEQCREAGRLDEVWFVPAGNPPHKQGSTVTRFEQRVEMIELAIAGHAVFRVEAIEKELPGLTYTADVLDALRQRHADVEFFLLLGADSFKDLPLWHEPWRILANATLLVMQRVDHETPDAEQLQAALHLPADRKPRLEVVPAPAIDIASRDVRRRVAEKRSIRYLVPRAVECYIKEKKLYLG